MTGRPRGETAASAIVALRLQPKDAERWKSHAADRGMTISDWLRDLAERNIARTGSAKAKKRA